MVLILSCPATYCNVKGSVYSQPRSEKYDAERAGRHRDESRSFSVPSLSRSFDRSFWGTLPYLSFGFLPNGNSLHRPIGCVAYRSRRCSGVGRVIVPTGRSRQHVDRMTGQLCSANVKSRALVNSRPYAILIALFLVLPDPLSLLGSPLSSDACTRRFSGCSHGWPGIPTRRAFGNWNWLWSRRVAWRLRSEPFVERDWCHRQGWPSVLAGLPHPSSHPCRC